MKFRLNFRLLGGSLLGSVPLLMQSPSKLAWWTGMALSVVAPILMSVDTRPTKP